MQQNDFIYNPIFLIFISYALGALATGLVSSLGWVKYFDEHHYISDKWTKRLGVLHFGWLIRNSFMGFFNQKLKYEGKAKKEKLENLIHEMTLAEIGHLLGFIFLLIFNTILIFYGIEWWYLLILFLINIVFNLYLVFLQQYNKRRIRKILARSHRI